MRIANIIMFLLFLTATALQWNDTELQFGLPKMLVWIPLYGLAALATGLAVAGKNSFLPLIAAPFYLGIAFARWPGADKAIWDKGGPAWETGGLLICGIWCAVLGMLWLRQRTKRNALHAPASKAPSA